MNCLIIITSWAQVPSFLQQCLIIISWAQVPLEIYDQLVSYVDVL